MLCGALEKFFPGRLLAGLSMMGLGVLQRGVRRSNPLSSGSPSPLYGCSVHSCGFKFSDSACGSLASRGFRVEHGAPSVIIMRARFLFGGMCAFLGGRSGVLKTGRALSERVVCMHVRGSTICMHTHQRRSGTNRKACWGVSIGVAHLIIVFVAEGRMPR